MYMQVCRQMPENVGHFIFSYLELNESLLGDSLRLIQTKAFIKTKSYISDFQFIWNTYLKTYIETNIFETIETKTLKDDHKPCLSQGCL